VEARIEFKAGFLACSNNGTAFLGFEWLVSSSCFLAGLKPVMIDDSAQPGRSGYDVPAPFTADGYIIVCINDGKGLDRPRKGLVAKNQDLPSLRLCM
jgi:hypothetical protein